MSSAVMEFEDKTLMQRLLDNLSEAEADRLDELCVSDDILAMRLWDVENDLVDAYVCGELSAEDQQRFKSHYLTTPRRLRKVQFAQSLVRFKQPEERIAALSRIPKTVASRRTAVPRHWQMALAAGIVLAVAAGFALDDVRLRQQLAGSGASIMNLTLQVRSSAQELDAQKKRAGSLAADTRRLEGLVTELRAASTAAGSAKPLIVRIASFLLLPPKRGLEAPPVLSVPQDVQQVEIRLMLEDNEFVHYRVSIKSRGGAASLWQSTELNAETGAQGASLKLHLPATAVKPGAYSIEVSGIAPKGAQTVASYAVSFVGPT